MTAPTQTDAQKAGVAINSVVTTEGVYMVPICGIYFGVGSGSPNGVLTAPQGSLFVDVSNPLLYMNTDAGKTWEAVAGQS